MIAVAATIKAEPGKGNQLVDALLKIAMEVRKEPGNIAYKIHQSVDDLDTIFAYEQYVDKAALNTHMEHLRELGGALEGLLSGPPNISLFHLKSE